MKTRSLLKSLFLSLVLICITFSNFPIIKADNLIDISSDPNITIEEIPDQIYTGYSVKPNVVIKYNGTLLTSGSEYIVDYYNNTDICENEAKAYVTITGRENNGYTGTVTKYFKIIELKDLSNPAVVIKLYEDEAHTIEKEQWTYTSSEITPYEVVTINNTTLVKGTDYEVTYENNTYPSSSSYQAGVKITAKVGGYYTGSQTKTFSIIPITAQIKTNATFLEGTYNGLSQQIILSPYESDDTETFRYGWYESVDATSAPKNLCNVYSDNSLFKKSAGKYKLYVEMELKQGYTFTPLSIEIEIAKKDYEITAPVLQDTLTYNNAEQKLIKTAAVPDPVDAKDSDDGSCEISYAMTSENVAPSADDTSIWKTNSEDIKVKNAGTYYIWYKVVPTDNFNGIDVTSAGSVIINKATPTIKDSFKDKEETYNGSAITVDALESHIELVGGEVYSKDVHGSIIYSYNKWLQEDQYEQMSSAPINTNYEHPYKVDVTFPESTNYNSVSKTVYLTIKKADPTLTDPTVISDLTYTGQDTLLINAGSTTGGTLQYGFGTQTDKPQDEDWSDNYEDIKKKESDTYYIWYRVVGNENYNDKDVDTPLTNNIAKANVTPTIEQLANGDISIKSDTSEYLRCIAENGEITLTFTISDNQETVTISNSDPNNKQIDIDDNKTEIKIPYSKFKDKNILIDKFKTLDPAALNTFNIKITQSNYDEYTSSINTTRGIEYINLYNQRNVLTADDQTLLDDNKIVFYLNGLKLTEDEAKNIKVVDEEESFVQTYLYNSSDKTIYDHGNYPTGFAVYKITQDADTNKVKFEHLEGLDNSLIYEGTSIRVSTVQSNGIRVITSIPKTTRSGLLANGVEGYKIVKYGTVISWAIPADSSYTADNPFTPYLIKGDTGYANATYTSSGVAYGYNSNNKFINSLFSQDSNSIYYTNVLIENPANSWNGKLKNDFVFRPFMILRPVGETTAANDLVIYGGAVNRSIYYVAKQVKENATAFYNSNTSIKNYINNIITSAEAPE